MSEAWFSDNFSDLSRSSGVEAGFQFEFYCERCRNAYRTPFEPYRSGQAAGWMNKASGMFGGILGNAGGAVEGIASQNFGKTRDDMFREAVAKAKEHFHRCAQCFQYVCDSCFNAASGLCYNCAPDAEVAGQAAKAMGKVSAAQEAGRAAGEELGAKIDVKTDKQLVCPNCGAEAHGAKFCAECGTKLAQVLACPSCSAELQPGVKFCPECGSQVAQA